MPHDALEHLLRKADASAAAPPTLTGLPARVRRRRQRRRMTKAIAVVAIAIIALPLLAMTLLTRPSPPPVVSVSRPAPTPMAATRQDLARLDLDASLHEQTAARLMAAVAAPSPPLPAAAAPERALAGESILADVRQQRDRAALVLIYDADRAARANDNGRALAAYRRTIELFPTTYWADVARRRLKEIPT